MALHTEWGIIDGSLLAVLGSVSTASSRGLHSARLDAQARFCIRWAQASNDAWSEHFMVTVKTNFS